MSPALPEAFGRGGQPRCSLRIARGEGQTGEPDQDQTQLAGVVNGHGQSQGLVEQCPSPDPPGHSPGRGWRAVSATTLPASRRLIGRPARGTRADAPGRLRAGRWPSQSLPRLRRRRRSSTARRERGAVPRSPTRRGAHLRSRRRSAGSALRRLEELLDALAFVGHPPVQVDERLHLLVPGTGSPSRSGTSALHETCGGCPRATPSERHFIRR
jgi:hypothetical protein